jgi:MoxR-like ATPase
VARVPAKFSAAEHAQWLAELAEAIEEAQKLLWRLGVSEGSSARANELYVRLEAARAEVESLRRSGSRELTAEAHPEWLELLLSSRSMIEI